MSRRRIKHDSRGVAIQRPAFKSLKNLSARLSAVLSRPLNALNHLEQHATLSPF